MKRLMSQSLIPTPQAIMHSRRSNSITPREAGLIISKSPSRGNIIIHITLTQPTYKRIPIEFNV